MTNLYRLITSVVIIFSLHLARGQDSNDLELGIKLPVELIHEIEKNVDDISKPIIINFWATWCAPCIEELRMLNTVLEETSEVNILSVTYEDEQIVSRFLERDSNRHFDNLTILPSDTLFIKFFPHRLLPHNIWINKDGVVQYITGGEDMTRENIHSFLEGIELNVYKKRDAINFDPFDPFEPSDSLFLYRSIFTKRQQGIPGGYTVQKFGFEFNQPITRVFFYNSILRNILWFAVNKNKSPFDYYNLMRIETRDSLKYFSHHDAPLSLEKSKYTSIEDWRANNTFCYELSLSRPAKESEFFEYMINDLNRILNIKVETTVDSILCSVVTAEDNYQNYFNNQDSSFLKLDKEGLKVQNVNVVSLLHYLNENVKENPNDIPKDPPFIDKTGGIYVDLNVDFEGYIPDYLTLKKMICERFKIKVTQQMDEYEITVIKDLD